MTPPTNSELLPCPFCGGQAQATHNGRASCQTEGCFMGRFYISIHQWNNRTSPSPATNLSELEKAIEDISTKDYWWCKLPEIQQLLSAAKQLEAINKATGLDASNLQFSLQLLTRAEQAEKKLEAVTKERDELHDEVVQLRPENYHLKSDYKRTEAELNVCAEAIQKYLKLGSPLGTKVYAESIIALADAISQPFTSQLLKEK